MKTLSSHSGAILYALAGYSFWVGADSFIKLAGAMAVPKYESIGIAAFSGMVIMFLVAALRGRLANLRPRHFAGLGTMSFFMILTYDFVMLGMQALPVVNFYSVLFAAPIVVSVLASFVFHEKMEWQKIAATCVGFIGVLIAMDIFAERDRGGWIGYGFAFLNMLVTVAMQLLVRFLGERESRESTAFYPRIGPVIACLLAGVVFGFQSMTMKEVFCSCMIGGLGSLGWFCVAEAYQRAAVSTVAPYQYSQIVTGALLGYALWDDVPTAHLWLGTAIITLSGIYITVHTHRAPVAPEIMETR